MTISSIKEQYVSSIDELESRSLEQWEALSREQRLHDVNRILTSRKLRSLTSLGDCSRGQPEFIGIEHINDSMGRFYTDIRFSTVFPKLVNDSYVPGPKGAFQPRFQANGAVADGVVVATVVNGRWAMLREWRPSAGQYLYSCPRGFSDAVDGVAKNTKDAADVRIDDLSGPLATLRRELSEEVMEGAVLKGFVHLGRAWTDSGTLSIAPDYFLAQISVDESILNNRLGGEEQLSVELWDIDMLKSRVGVSGGIECSLTLTALFLARSHLERMLGA